MGLFEKNYIKFSRKINKELDLKRHKVNSKAILDKNFWYSTIDLIPIEPKRITRRSGRLRSQYDTRVYDLSTLLPISTSEV
jgi:hypothetical protein